MEHIPWPDVGRDLSSVRRAAAAFLENLAIEDNSEPTVRQNWIARWTKIGDDHNILGDLIIKKGALDEAIVAWLVEMLR
ncbi:hypothetical protein QRQ56_35315 [Bradyrhizobium sp. U531]|uniref:hypothetical protein n=1 Tax=Bradyrhizobium sp. U531 TaxID=3053458 RepID=UPI003F4432CF